MPRKSLRRRRRRSSKKSKKTFTKQLTKRSKSKKIRGGVTVRAQDLTRLNRDVFGEIREFHPLLTPKLNNITLRQAIKDLSDDFYRKRYVLYRYGEIEDWDVSKRRGFGEHVAHVLDARGVPRADVLVEGRGVVEHPVHRRDAGGVPRADVLVEGRGAGEHPSHRCDARGVPGADVLVEGRCA